MKQKQIRKNTHANQLCICHSRITINKEVQEEVPTHTAPQILLSSSGQQPLPFHLLNENKDTEKDKKIQINKTVKSQAFRNNL